MLFFLKHHFGTPPAPVEHRPIWPIEHMRRDIRTGIIDRSTWGLGRS